ncbi:hypothetical protein PHJA_002321600 [Phtheirospermum japonicum]|uniref:RING-type domain-containing protein n=1 Tax=Phtheirospermum japonicum TaxID=374723 RepID=A0A830CR69_9LAMI|nr:hypothetical protein PHJA_002321600 [Phtheirospermum japonicum]
MGKRKRRADNNKAPPPSDMTQHAPQVDLQCHRRSSERAESSATQHPPSFMDALNSSLKNHALLLRPSRHSLGRHYSRRNSTNHSDASPSNWMATPSYDAKLSFKIEKKDVSDIPYRVSGDARKMECKICEKRLRKHPFIIENSISSGDFSVVAVLVCGHAYHADCLEQNTNPEDSQDPNCPLCGSKTS